jgi:hypothetical protein
MSDGGSTVIGVRPVAFIGTLYLDGKGRVMNSAGDYLRKSEESFARADSALRNHTCAGSLPASRLTELKQQAVEWAEVPLVQPAPITYPH